jgi:hypothetical protein
MCYNTNTPTYRNYTFIKNKVKQFRIYCNYFKEMNEVENDDIEIVINLNEDNHDDVLNVPISQAATYRNYTFIKNKVKQFRIYWNHKIHSIL